MAIGTLDGVFIDLAFAGASVGYGRNGSPPFFPDGTSRVENSFRSMITITQP